MLYYVILYYIILYVLYTHVLCLTPQTELTTVKKQLFTIFRHLGSIRECQVELKVGSNGFAKALRSCSKVDIVAAFMFLNHLHTHISIYINMYMICIYMYIYMYIICIYVGVRSAHLRRKISESGFPKVHLRFAFAKASRTCVVFSHTKL